MMLATQVTSRLWSMHCEVKEKLSTITISLRDSTQHVSRPTSTITLLALFLPHNLTKRKSTRPNALLSAEFPPESFFASRKLSMASIIDLFDHLFQNFTRIQSGNPLESEFITDIPSIATLSTKILASTSVRPSGGEQKANQHIPICHLCMATIYEAIITQEYREAILKGSGGKIRQGMEDIFSKYKKEGTTLDGFWVDGLHLADVMEDDVPEVLGIDALKALESKQDGLSVREKHKMQIQKMVETMEGWDFVQAHKKHPEGTIDEEFRASLHSLLHVRLQLALGIVFAITYFLFFV